MINGNTNEGIEMKPGQVIDIPASPEPGDVAPTINIEEEEEDGRNSIHNIIILHFN